LKIPLLLVQYLYTNRRIALPGLGVFTLDKSVVLPDEHDKALHSMPNAVQFQNANIAAADKELINFICENTGKIRPLAISDLDSYLNLGTEMLNIGKPFYLEGIGTITKNKNGKFDFTPGEYALIRENTGSSDSSRKKSHGKDKKHDPLPAASQDRGVLKIVALIAALIIVGLGGYMMYKKNGPASSEITTDTNSVVTEQKPAITTDSQAASSRPDSVKAKTGDTVHPAAVETATYKFVILNSANKDHALRRYNQLISFGLKPHLYQKDSSYFKVYFQFPALSKDTTHIKDSLRREYAHNVIIEP
jgi:hypothetical protein